MVNTSTFKKIQTPLVAVNGTSLCKVQMTRAYESSAVLAKTKIESVYQNIRTLDISPLQR